MSISSKSSIAQIPRLMLYRRALHPELFDLKQRRTNRYGSYEIEAWLVRSGHVLRLSHMGRVLTEAVLDASTSEVLPESGLVHALPCLGEKEFEMPKAGRIGYCTSLQTENLADNLYQTTYDEMLDFAQESDAISHVWESEAGRCLSMLEVQQYRREFHLQSYHLNPVNGSVLRTQSIFEIHESAS